MPALKLGHQPQLDGLRGIAVLAVFIFHTKLVWFPKFRADGGLLGVDLFFVLSGFLITSLLLQEHSSSGRISRLGFYTRRALRLLPALGLALALGAVIASYIGNATGTMSYGRSALVAVSFAGNWFGSRLGLLAHTWSLGLEEQYYVIWPLILAVALRRKVRLEYFAGALVVVAMGAAAFRAVMDRSAASFPMGDPRPVLRVDGILLGSALAMILASRHYRSARLLLSERALGMAALICAAAIATWATRFDLRTYDAIFLLDLCIAFVVGHIVTAPGAPISRLFKAGPLTAIGRISYGLYLFHWPLFVLSGRMLKQPVMSVGVAWASAFAVSVVSYFAVERPAARLKRHIAPRRARKVRYKTLVGSAERRLPLPAGERVAS
jgi:peptidoglycan/LPS O-acetylase OafA/YrhL